MHFDGELLICRDGWRSHNRFYPDIAALTRFEWLCEHMNVFAIQPSQGARDIAGVFIAIGYQDRSLEMVRSKAAQRSIEGAGQVGLTLIDRSIAALACPLHLAKFFDRLECPGIRSKCDKLRVIGPPCLVGCCDPVESSFDGAGLHAAGNVEQVDNGCF